MDVFYLNRKVAVVEFPGHGPRISIIEGDAKKSGLAQKYAISKKSTILFQSS